MASPKKKSDTDSGSATVSVGDEVTVYPGSSSSALPHHGETTGTVTVVHEDGTVDIEVSDPPVSLSSVSALSDELTPDNYGGHLYSTKGA